MCINVHTFFTHDNFSTIEFIGSKQQIPILVNFSRKGNWQNKTYQLREFRDQRKWGRKGTKEERGGRSRTLNSRHWWSLQSLFIWVYSGQKTKANVNKLVIPQKENLDQWGMRLSMLNSKERTELGEIFI